MSDPKRDETTRWNPEEVREQTAEETARWDPQEVREQVKKEEVQEASLAVTEQELAVQSPGKSRHKLGWVIYIVCVIAGSALLAGIGWLMINDVCALNKEPVETTIEVEKGESVGSVAKKLKKAGLIDSKTLFMVFGSIFDAKETIGPGVYELNSDMDFRCLINSMESSQSLVPEGVVRVTIPEGSTVQQTIQLLAEAGVASEEDLTKAAEKHVFKDHPFVDNEHLGKVTRLEGYLAPDTYEFFENEDPAKALSRMLDNFAVWMTDEMKEDIKKSGHSMHDIVVMASLIEKEAIGDDEERANIGSVLYNRLANPQGETAGYLQLDSTIYYVLRQRGMDDSEFSTDIDSGYNTYKHQGLPEGPICNPSRSSLMAAVYPTDTDYYYFAYGKDGVSHFFKDYDEHLKFVNSDMYQPD